MATATKKKETLKQFKNIPRWYHSEEHLPENGREVLALNIEDDDYFKAMYNPRIGWYVPGSRINSFGERMECLERMIVDLWLDAELPY